MSEIYLKTLRFMRDQIGGKSQNGEKSTGGLFPSPNAFALAQGIQPARLYQILAGVEYFQEVKEIEQKKGTKLRLVAGRSVAPLSNDSGEAEAEIAPKADPPRIPGAVDYLEWLVSLGVHIVLPDEWEKIHGADQFIGVPKLRVDPEAAFAEEGEEEELYAFRREFLEKYVDPVLVEVSGDSMEPTLPDKSLVLLDQSQKTIVPGRIYGLEVDDAVMIRRLDKAPNKLILRADNSSYRELEVPLGQVDGLRVLGRVVWVAREL